MEDMSAIVLYGYEGDHVESDDSVESNPDHYESVGKKPRLDNYEEGYSGAYETDGEDVDEDDDDDDDDDVSSLGSLDNEYGPGGKKLSVEEMLEIKRETRRKFRAWAATIKDEDTFAFFDTSGACILNADKSKINDEALVHDLASSLHMCRRRMTIYTFSRPGEDGYNEEGGATIVHESSELGELELQSYSTKARKVIQQYNDAVTNKHCNSNSELVFVSFLRSVHRFPNSLFITFTARQNGDDQIGTYQAALSDDFFGIEVQLILLRHVEADKILAILSLDGFEEEMKALYGENWNRY